MTQPDLRDAGELLRPAVDASLGALDLKPEHAAAATLAETYASLIDESHRDPKLFAWAVRWVGPLLLDALESLGATPVSRGKVKPEGKPGAPSGLTALRAARRA